MKVEKKIDEELKKAEAKLEALNRSNGFTRSPSLETLEIKIDHQAIRENLRQYLISEIPKKYYDTLIINDEFWLPPTFQYWPSQNVMKDLITIASNTETILDLNF